mgnify:CR=1 FL=1
MWPRNINVFEYRKKLNPKYSIESFLYKSTYNKFIDTYYKNKSRSKKPFVFDDKAIKNAELERSLLIKLLIEKGYKVYGTVRRSTSEKFVNLKYLNVYDKIKFYDFDLLVLSFSCYYHLYISEPISFDHISTSFKEGII